MCKRFLLIPINCGHSLLSKIKLKDGAEFRLYDDWALQKMFDGSMNYGFSGRDFIMSMCPDIKDGWKDLILIYEYVCTDFGIVLDDSRKFINDLILKIRLFTASDVYVNDMFSFGYRDGIPQCGGSISLGSMRKSGAINLLTLNEEDVVKLQKFIDEFSLENCSTKLREAISIYNQSFMFLDFGLRIVLLTTVLEMLFGLNVREELSYRVSRNSAIFYSRDKTEFDSNFAKIKNFYKQRSIFVHTGKANDVTPESISELQMILSNILLKYSVVEKKHEITQDLLTSAGFENLLE